MYRKRAILFTISIILLALLFFTVDYNEFYRIASKLSMRWITILVGAQLFIMLLGVIRWYILVRRYSVSFINVLSSSLVGLMANSLTPMNFVGGEAARAYVLSRTDRIKMEDAFATVVADLFLSVIPLFLLDLLAIFLVFKHSLDIRIAWLLGIIGLFILAMVTASFNVLINHDPSLRLFKALLGVFKRVSVLRKYVARLESRVDDLFMSFHRSIRTTMADTWTLTVGMIMSVSVWVLTLFRVYMIFSALGVDVDFEVVVIVYSVLLMVSILPLLPGALGLWEWVGTGLFTFFGIPLAAAAAAVIVDRLLFYWLPILTGFLASLHVGLNVMKVIDKPD